jgi:hypothetical protein
LPSSADIWEAKREIESLRQQLAECQAREKVLRDGLLDIDDWDSATLSASGMARLLDLPSDSTALDAMLKHAKSEALLKAATEFEECNPTAEIARCSVGDELRRMAHELQS